MRNIALKVEYDGSTFSGWQRQKNALSVQQVLEEAVEHVLGKPVKVIGAGRTDAGVHALGMICNFRCETELPADCLPYVLNRELPRTVRVTWSGAVPIGFHARYHSAGKHYQYLLRIGRFPTPILENRAWQFYEKPDLSMMKQAAKKLEGIHDYRSFCASGSSVKSTVRTIYSIKITERDGLIRFDFHGSGFLYNMVRILVGTLVYVGIGKLSPEDVERLLMYPDRRCAGITAPACGLYLVSVKYTRRYWCFLHPVPAGDRIHRSRMKKTPKWKKSQRSHVFHTQSRVFVRKNGKFEKDG